MIKKYIIPLLMILNLLPLWAGGTEEKDAEEQATEALAEKCKNRMILSPILFYSPETGFAFGAAGSFIFRLSGCKKADRPSSVSPFVIYTLRKQFIAQVKTDLYSQDNDYQLKSEVLLDKYPTKFFGVGSRSLEEDEEAYTSTRRNLLLTFIKKLGKGLYIGFRYHFMDWNILEKESGGQLDRGDLTGSDGGTISGIGFLLNRDTRDNLFSPRQGDLFELNVEIYDKFIGSGFNFVNFKLDLRRYFPLFASQVFAVQAVFQTQSGAVPFMSLAKMGGPTIMRGYYEGRFRDKSLLVFQAEYRMPLFWRLGLVGFAGLGNVAETPGQLDIGELKTSYGLGFRFVFDKKEKINLRMDIGFGKDSRGFYVSIFEAF